MFIFPDDYLWYGDQCPECGLPLTIFWIERGVGINNKEKGFKPQVIIKFRCLYFHHTQDLEFFQFEEDQDSSFDDIIEECNGRIED